VVFGHGTLLLRLLFKMILLFHWTLSWSTIAHIVTIAIFCNLPFSRQNLTKIFVTLLLGTSVNESKYDLWQCKHPVHGEKTFLFMLLSYCYPLNVFQVWLWHLPTKINLFVTLSVLSWLTMYVCLFE
jgi:hypothetical protein